jgi:hypothetical protein
MLLCKQIDCEWHLAYLDWSQSETQPGCCPHQRIKMSKTAALHALPTASLFSRFMATIDRLLMASARIAIRNGDLPYPGL